MIRIGGLTRYAASAWANLPLRLKGLVVIAIPLSALVASAAFYFASELADQQAEGWVTHTYNVRSDVKTALAIILDAEDGVRGYLLSGREDFLDPYLRANDELPTALADLARLVQDSPPQSARMHRITSLAEQKLDALTRLRYSTATTRGGLLATSKTLTDALRRDLGAMQADEDRFLSERTAHAEGVRRQILAAIVLSLLVGLSCGFLATTLFTAGIGSRVRRLEEGAAQLTAGIPVTPLAFGKDEIGRLGHALGESSNLLLERDRELRAAKEDAERANKAKSEFLSRMSHELRTPLNAVLGFGQLLEMGRLAPEHHESVDQILKGGRHLLTLIDEVLDIARIETGRLSVSPEPVRTSDVLRETLDLIAPVAAQRHVQLSGDDAGMCVSHVRADRQRLKQVFLNLLSNAVKYNRDGGAVFVSCEETGEGRLRIKVRDTGPGISADKMRRLFTPFDRLGAEQTGVEGTGLGLSVSKHLVEAMGGALGVESAPGRGSTFWVELPRTDAPVNQLEGVTESLPALANAPGVVRTILCIEDNLSNYELVGRILRQRYAAKLIGAVEGQKGLALAREHRPHLILLDLHLPDIPGEEVLRRLRDDPETSGIPVVMISADATSGRIQRLLSAGAKAYITKPFDIRGFLEILSQTLEA